MKVDLILIGKLPSRIAEWDLGKVLISSNSVSELSSIIKEAIQTTDAEYLLFWNASLAPPNAEKVRRVINLPGEAWHCGLKFAKRTFRLLDFVNPVWMLNKDADDNIESSSYKLTLDACIIKTEVIEQLGFIDPHFESIEAAALELGYRYIYYGVFVRYIPWLVNKRITEVVELPIQDQLTFIRLHFRELWLKWAILRGVISKYLSLAKAIRAYHRIKKIQKINISGFKKGPPKSKFDMGKWQDRISVVIPTLRRYPYLKRVLGQLNKQTLKPLEVIVVDQTPEDLREEINEEFNFSLKVLYQKRPGQSSSRNRGITETKGEYTLFLDDDIEMENGLVEKHARTIDFFKADVSSGVNIEPGMILPYSFKYPRIGDVFPAGDSLVKKSIFEKSGLFDLAFEKVKHADHDLGMRLYLSGAFMVLNPEIKVIHHRASRGGLREYGERTITRYLSKRYIFSLDFPSSMEIYLWLKYADHRLAREAIYIKTLSNFSVEGTLLKRLARVLIVFLALPGISARLYSDYKKASELIRLKNK